MNRTLLLFSLLLLSLAAESTPAAPNWQLHPVLGGFQRPVQAVFLPGSESAVYVAEQAGRIIRHAKGKRHVLLDIRSRTNSGNEEGLLSIAFEPGSVDGRTAAPTRILISYTTGRPSFSIISSLTLRGKGSGLRVVSGSERVILRLAQPYSNHNGGQILFGPDKKLYVGFGDGGAGGDPLSSGQNPGVLLGKILRIIPKYSGGYQVPSDNPFVRRVGYRPEIFALGLRNPWRMSFDSQTGLLFVGDVGQNRQEEINVVRSGDNLGWNIVEGKLCFKPRRNCKASRFTAPLHVYGRRSGGSITGGPVYRGRQLAWLYGQLLFADYVSGNVWAFPVDAGGKKAGPARLLLRGAGNISSFAENPNGEVYLLEHRRGKILLLKNRPNPSRSR